MPPTETYAEGWAIVDDRGLNIQTVCATREAAILNWLVNVLQMTAVVNMGPEGLEYLWKRHGVNPGRATVQEVTVRVQTARRLTVGMTSEEQAS